MISDIATKKLLITTLAGTPDTADTSVLDALSNMRALATPVADKLALRLQKRDDQKMVYDYGYHFGPSPVEMINIRNANIRKLNGEGLKARMDELAKTWTPEQQVERIQKELADAATKAGYIEERKQNDIKADQKEAALNAWFADFCKTIDAKMLYVVSNIPGYVAPASVVLVAKKTTPTQGQVQVTLARAFKEEIIDKEAFIASLHEQLETSMKAEAKSVKTLETRKIKRVDQKNLRKEAKIAKTEGKEFKAPRKPLGFVKSDFAIKTEDHVDLEMANWFYQHAIVIKSKIAIVESQE
jgi:hypothetical protein